MDSLFRKLIFISACFSQVLFASWEDRFQTNRALILTDPFKDLWPKILLETNRDTWSALSWVSRYFRDMLAKFAKDSDKTGLDRVLPWPEKCEVVKDAEIVKSAYEFEIEKKRRADRVSYELPWIVIGNHAYAFAERHRHSWATDICCAIPRNQVVTHNTHYDVPREEFQVTAKERPVPAFTLEVLLNQLCCTTEYEFFHLTFKESEDHSRTMEQTRLLELAEGEKLILPLTIQGSTHSIAYLIRSKEKGYKKYRMGQVRIDEKGILSAESIVGAEFDNNKKYSFRRSKVFCVFGNKALLGLTGRPKDSTSERFDIISCDLDTQNIVRTRTSSSIGVPVNFLALIPYGKSYFLVFSPKKTACIWKYAPPESGDEENQGKLIHTTGCSLMSVPSKISRCGSYLISLHRPFSRSGYGLAVICFFNMHSSKLVYEMILDEDPIGFFVKDGKLYLYETNDPSKGQIRVIQLPAQFEGLDSSPVYP